MGSKDISESELTKFSNPFDSVNQGKEDNEVFTLSNRVNENTINQRNDDVNKWGPGNIDCILKATTVMYEDYSY